MSDVLLERIAVALERIAANGGPGNPQTGPSSSPSGLIGSDGLAPTTAPQAATTVGGVSGVSVGGAPAGVGQNVTHEMLMSLVQPLVQDEGTKAQVRSVLNQHGLNRLGEANETQYFSLYTAFQQIGAPQAQPQQSNDLI